MVEDSKLRASVQQGIEALNANNSRLAIIQFRQAISIQPKSAELHLHLGSALELAGQDSEAMREYQFAISLDPGLASGHTSLAKLFLAHGHAEHAIQGFKRALTLQPNSPEVLVWLAQALIAINHEDSAIECLRQSIELNPDVGDPYVMLGYRLQTKGQFDEARDCFYQAILIQPRQAVAYYGISQGKRFSNSDSELIRQMQAQCADERLHPRDRVYLLFSLGKAYADLGDFQLAMEVFRGANQLAFQVSLGGRPFPRERYAQIVDETIRKFSSGYLVKRHSLGSKSAKPIFIVGMMRSGTTLLDHILSSHPKVGAIGERDFWLRLGLRDFSDKEFARVQEQFLALLQSGGGSRPYVTDKTPQNFQALGLIHTAFPNSPIIHVRRHPIDNCLSIFTTAYDISPDFAHDESSIVFAYREYRRLMAHWRSVIPADKLLEIDYEDLVSDKEEVIRRVIAFCGLEWDENCLMHEGNDRVVKTPSLWQVRQPIYKTSVGRWRKFEPWLGELIDVGNGQTLEFEQSPYRATESQ